MKKTLFVSTLAFLFFQACKHEITTPINPVTSIAIVATPGSYWVYDWYKIDSVGNETYYTSDSVYVLGDTSIRNKTYIVYKGTDLGSPKTELIRDSIGFIVSATGRILWNKNSIGNIDYIGSTDFNIWYAISSLKADVSTPAGDFEGIQKRRTACYPDGRPFTPCDHCYTDYTYYVEGIGIVLEQTAYIGEVNRSCTYLEKRLVRYEIK